MHVTKNLRQKLLERLCYIGLVSDNDHRRAFRIEPNRRLLKRAFSSPVPQTRSYITG